VTGGSKGIGAAIAQRLLGGATVVVTARSTSDEMPKGAKFIKGDVSTNEGAKAIAAETLKALGGIDIIINYAGAARAHLQGTASIPDGEWQDALDMNFLSAVRVTNALLPALKQSKAGAITARSCWPPCGSRRGGRPLVSDRGQWITGHNYFVDGGMWD
jgi:NAD(P)-dependent dehydrogenase (short-subunit alcohol dehydrogenase family)